LAIPSIGDNIRRLRLAVGYTQEELGFAMGIGHARKQRVYEWEIGKRVPGAASLMALAKALKCSPGDILGMDDNYKKEKEAT